MPTTHIKRLDFSSGISHSPDGRVSNPIPSSLIPDDIDSPHEVDESPGSSGGNIGSYTLPPQAAGDTFTRTRIC